MYQLHTSMKHADDIADDEQMTCPILSLQKTIKTEMMRMKSGRVLLGSKPTPRSGDTLLIQVQEEEAHLQSQAQGKSWPRFNHLMRCSAGMMDVVLDDDGKSMMTLEDLLSGRSMSRRRHWVVTLGWIWLC